MLQTSKNHIAACMPCPLLCAIRLRSVNCSVPPALFCSQFTGASDPYAVLSVGGSIGRSSACFQTLNPTWNTKMCLYVRDAGSDVLRVSGG